MHFLRSLLKKKVATFFHVAKLKIFRSRFSIFSNYLNKLNYKFFITNIRVLCRLRLFLGGWWEKILIWVLILNPTSFFTKVKHENASQFFRKKFFCRNFGSVNVAKIGCFWTYFDIEFLQTSRPFLFYQAKFNDFSDFLNFPQFSKIFYVAEKLRVNFWFMKAKRSKFRSWKKSVPHFLFIFWKFFM